MPPDNTRHRAHVVGEICALRSGRQQAESVNGERQDLETLLPEKFRFREYETCASVFATDATGLFEVRY